MTLPRATPSRQGVDAGGIVSFLDAVHDLPVALRSLMVAKDGHVVAEGWAAPHGATDIQLVYSCSKSFTASAVGLLVDSGRMSLQDPVLDHLPWDRLATPRESLGERWQRATLEHCLSMTLGHDDDAWGRATEGAFTDGGRPSGIDWLDLVLRTELDHEPGTTFSYNQVATYLVARAVEHVTGTGLLDFLRENLFGRIGLDGIGSATHTDTAGHALGFSGLHLPTHALLHLAQLYLDEGRWGGEQVLTGDWVRRARTPFGPPNRDPQGNPDWTQGYGLSFWNARHGYRGDGAYGQYAIVLPEQRTAIAITSETEDMQAVLDALWTHVLPALDRPGSAAADSALAQRLGGLTVEPPGFREAAATRLPSTWRVVGATRQSADGGWVLELEGTGGRHRLTAGEGTWARSEWSFGALSLPLLARVRPGSAPGGPTLDVLVAQTPHRFVVILDPERVGRSGLHWQLLPLSGPDPARLAVART